ncbi:MAG: hypothetical protein K6T61_12245, partial [Bryobacteraceae bacterium]|nr:hypothetical protein [Bryobacteraceae bacterium]
MPSLEQIAWWINVGLALALLARLLHSRLRKVYFWFLIQLLFQSAQNLAMLPLNPTTNLYAWVYLFTQPVTWVLYILVVLEVYSLALRNHPGLATLSRWVLTSAMFAALAISAFTLTADLSKPPGKFPLLVYYGIAERGVTFSLVLFLVIIIGFLAWTPVPVRRNIVLHAALYTTYFLASSASLFLRNILGYELVAAVSVAQISINNLCLLLWILFLNRKGEET